MVKINFVVAGKKRSSPRSPESQRKNFGTWTAKVAAAKKKSLERKKGADTVSMMSMMRTSEEGGDGSEPSAAASADKSIFAIWNRDGTPAQGEF